MIILKVKLFSNKNEKIKLVNSSIEQSGKKVINKFLNGDRSISNQEESNISSVAKSAHNVFRKRKNASGNTLVIDDTRGKIKENIVPKKKSIDTSRQLEIKFPSSRRGNRIQENRFVNKEGHTVHTVTRRRSNGKPGTIEVSKIEYTGNLFGI